MTKFATAAALILATATGSAAIAATDGQIAEIERFANVDASGLSNAEVASLLNVIHSGDSVSEKRALVQNLVGKYQ
ncbi:hypothetical protein FIU97_02155 [Roseivivax sp. THAF40]|uniref:hypothetical protein n=1 Tax=unclassified Roseivivax TaxID=2639302 RepID=UPI001268FFE3|nr:MULTISPECIES: hypothetical protein [unclassified Roseivivax]QFS81639.1 hypothetical protein FIV09_02250 [Roseivivax sp. THAF197b]QFT45368.1 hypothetical protein FIU97_02155 [Roseivivax sp. THAF40]